MSAEPTFEDDAPVDDSRFAGVLRFYELAKHQEWQGKDVPWGDLPPIPQGEGSPQRAARPRGGGGPAADPRGEGLAAAAGSTSRRVALRRHAAAAGRRLRVRDGGAASECVAASGGEALLLDDGARRVAPHRGVAEADRADRRRGGARPASGPARAHVSRGGHA